MALFRSIWRGINSERHLREGTYMSAFRLGTYIATQFKPVVAKTIYDMTKANTVLDTLVVGVIDLQVSLLVMQLNIMVATQTLTHINNI